MTGVRDSTRFTKGSELITWQLKVELGVPGQTSDFLLCSLGGRI
jgi:hypothetical protein